MAVIDTDYLSDKYNEVNEELSSALAKDEPDANEVLRWWLAVQTYGSLIEDAGSLGGSYTKAELQAKLDEATGAFDGVLHNRGGFLYEQIIGLSELKKVLTQLIADSD